MATDVPFFRIPAEVRLQIFGFLLTNHDLPILSIRTEEGLVWESRKYEMRRRTKYKYIASWKRARTMEAIYHLLQNPGIDASILCTNRQIHTEASHVLYSRHTFDFGTHIESVVPFFSDLTPEALSSIEHIDLLKPALLYTKESDHCEWRNACAFITENMKIKQLDLMIEGGKPQQQWQSRETYTKAEFRLIVDFEGMEWAKQISAINGLEVLSVRAHLKHYPPPTNSRAMAFFVDFSANIERAFTEWLKEKMLVGTTSLPAQEA